MKISVCITVLNEEKNIHSLLASLLSQTKKPIEINIVDAKSSDNTVMIIKKYQKIHKSIKLKIEAGSIAHCRNVSIMMAKGGIIALTDSGCIPNKDWLEKMYKPFREYRCELLVAGFYTMPFSNSIQEVASVYLGIPEKRFNPKKFLPSARSVAFSKTVWVKIGGFDESLEKGGEDTKFFYDCVKNNVKIVRVGNARVSWLELSQMNLATIANKFYVYAKGDGQAKIWWHLSKQLSSHNIKISLVFLRYLIFFLMFDFSMRNFIPFEIVMFLLILYILWPIYKWRDVIKSFKSRLFLPLMQFISDIYVMSGFLAGTIKGNA